jgi:hypothetical protein
LEKLGRARKQVPGSESVLNNGEVGFLSAGGFGQNMDRTWKMLNLWITVEAMEI